MNSGFSVKENLEFLVLINARLHKSVAPKAHFDDRHRLLLFYYPRKSQSVKGIYARFSCIKGCARTIRNWHITVFFKIVI